MARRATVIREAKVSGKPVLVLDAGNSLVPIGGGAGSNEPAQGTRGQTSVEALNRLGYDAVALGVSDALLGREDLRKRIAEARGFTFVSANLLDKDTGKLLVEPFIIRQVGGHRVALLGVTGRLVEEGRGLATRDALETAREYVARVQSQADIVILLSNAGAEVNRAIAEQVPGVDLIISGGSQSQPGEVPVGQSVLVVQADLSTPGDAGRYLGRLEVEFDYRGVLGKHTWSPVELGPSIADDPGVAAWVASLPQR